MKRKIITLLMLSCIAISTTACGNSKEPWIAQYNDYRNNEAVVNQVTELPAAETPAVASTPVDEVGYQADAAPTSTQEQISEENTLYEYEVQGYTEVPVQAEQNGITAAIIEENPTAIVSAEEKAEQEESQRLAAEQAAAEKARQEAEAQKAKEATQTAQNSNVNNGTTATSQTFSQAPTTSSGNGGNNNFNTYNNTEQQNTTASWVLNTNSMKIHYPSCKNVPKIAQKNYATSNENLDSLKAQGYDTCGNCFK